MEVTIEQLARAIRHGWWSCEPEHHLSIRRVWWYLTEGCDKPGCDCKTDDPMWWVSVENGKEISL